MWLLADYLPTTFFSLRPASATSSGGKSLLSPTPFAIKMALLDAAIHTQGVTYGEQLFPQVRDLCIAISLPAQIVLNSTFIKILRLKEFKGKKDQRAAFEADAKANHQWPFQTTIGYREYVHLPDLLCLAFEGMDTEELTNLLLQINYLGKRGGFVQLADAPRQVESLPDGYTELTTGVENGFPLGILQMMDDFAPHTTFAHANVFDSKRMTLGKDRILRHVVLPYRIERASRGFTLYTRIDGVESPL